MKKQKIVNWHEKAKGRAKELITYARTQKSGQIYEHGLQFLKKFKHSLYKGKTHTFLIDFHKSFATQPIAIALKTNNKAGKTEILFEARLKFEKNTILVESIQGTKLLAEMREFESLAGIPTSRFIIKEIINQAKNMNYNQVKLRRAERHQSYKNPNWTTMLTKQEKQLHLKVALGDASLNEIKELTIIKNEAIKTIRLRMKKLYDVVAAAEGFKTEGNYFVKNI
ncbi:MAG: hypothetical protein WC915_01465 [archaeon]|jgi:hypothetical protein